MAGTVAAVEKIEAIVAAGVDREVGEGVIIGPLVAPIPGCIAGAGAVASSLP